MYLYKIAVVEELIQNLKEYFETNNNAEVPLLILWEGAKAVMRGKMIQNVSHHKKRCLKEQIRLETKIKQLKLYHKKDLKT